MLGDVAPPSTQPPARPRRGRAYAGAVLAVAVATAAAGGVDHVLRAAAGRPGDRTNVAMVYLLAVVFVAARLGLGPAVAASGLGVAAFDYFFVPPCYTLAVGDAQYLVTFAVILVVGGLTSRADRPGPRAGRPGPPAGAADGRPAGPEPRPGRGPGRGRRRPGDRRPGADVFAGRAAVLLP